MILVISDGPSDINVKNLKNDIISELKLKSDLLNTEEERILRYLEIVYLIKICFTS